MGRVRGYHGTSRAAAERIQEEGFVPSRNSYDWLGDGVYFFQDSESRARSWAEKLHGREWAVVTADIELGNCFDFLENVYFDMFTDAYNNLLALHKVTGFGLPVQKPGRHGLDRMTINFIGETLSEAGQALDTVRALFQEGRAAYPGSALFNQSHIQIAVRDVSHIEIVGIATETGPC